MRTLGFHRSPTARAVILVAAGAYLALFPPALPTALAHASTPSASSFDDLMIQAEEKRAAGVYAESAALYGQAYRARSDAERADQIGEITVRNAMADYDLVSPSKPDLALLEAEAQLLDEFLADRREAQVPEVPQDLVEELARLDAQIAELREAERKAAEEAAKPEPEPEPELEIEPLPEPEPGPTGTSKADAAILSVGLVTLVGGTALIASGAWNFVQIRKRGDAQLDALDANAYVDEPGYRSELDDWQQQWRGAATALVVTGAVLAGTGIGLTSWGIVRMRKHRSPSSARAAFIPAIGRQHLGVRLTVAF
jgi:hypothetical protein